MIIMKIILCNKFYYYRGGDCIYSINLEKLLKEKGHEVAFFAMDYSLNLENEFSSYFPREISFSKGSISDKLEAIKRIFSSDEVKIKFQKLIDDFSPDIVHINNVHSYLSPILAEIAKKNNVKVIWTLHDYKLICPSYSCIHNLKPCEKCFDAKINVLKCKCMKNSYVASTLAYFESKFWNKNRIEKSVDHFICPSEFLKTKMQLNNYNVEKLTALHNFSDFNIKEINLERDKLTYLYIGRLSAEKGVHTLLKVASEMKYTLYIAGTGPLDEELRNLYKNNKNIIFLGHLDKSQLLFYLNKTRFIVIPSEWYENNPLTVIESLLIGTPVLGAEIGGIPELLNKENGKLFKSGDRSDLAQKIELMFNTSFNYEDIASKAYNLYNKERYYRDLLNVYEK